MKVGWGGGLNPFTNYDNNFDENKHEKHRISILEQFVFQGFKAETKFFKVHVRNAAIFQRRLKHVVTRY